MGAHTFDTKATTSQTSWSRSNPYTLSYTAGAGSTVMVLGIATAGTTARTGGAPTYNGIAFTQIESSVSSGSEGRIEMWYLLNPPTGSAYTVSVPNTNARTMNYMVSTYISSTGISAFDVSASKSAIAANPSQSVTTTKNGDVVIDALFDGHNDVPTANTHILLYSSDDGSYSNNGQYHLQPTAGAITLGWTVPSDDYALITAAFKEVSPMNITSHGNNYTNNNTLSITVNQSTVVSFNLTSNISINSNTTSISSGVTPLSNSSPGGTTFFANFSFPEYGTKYVNLSVTNTTGGSDYRNWTVTVNDVTPPSQVTNLTNITIPTHDSINLGWDAGTDNAGGSGIKDYLIDVMNNSINWAAYERPTINATGIAAGYKNDSYWYTFRNNIPVNCSLCHSTLGTREFAIGNFWLKFNSTYLYAFAHVADNDTDAGDDYIKFGFDPLKDGGSAPQTDDRLYKLYENGTMITYSGNGSGWDINASLTNISAVEGAGSNGLRFEMAIPLSEIGAPVNGSSVNFIFESECKNGSDFQTRSTFFPATGDDDIPSTWTLLTYRNSTQWDNIGTSTVNEYSVNNLLSNFRYGFSVRARDNVSIVGNRSASFFGQTADREGYNITGFVTSSGTPLSGAHLSVGEYVVSTIADGSYTLSDLANGTYTINVNATEMEGNSTGITISGADQVLNFSLNDTVAPSVASNTNNAYFANNTPITLSAAITDMGSGVKNATVNIS
ncbi:MAG: carboxypeptidase-like regulatory domain-containing protein, partial [Candidatus Methanoperedens sp.]|nr:carboxypeptidase-like regulatory domain-containing protein [Candidatus Methanoperedens sp.]